MCMYYVSMQALWAALCRGHLAGVGLDVHWVEPADPSEPFYRHPKVLSLPHLGVVAEVRLAETHTHTRTHTHPKVLSRRTWGWWRR